MTVFITTLHTDNQPIIKFNSYYCQGRGNLRCASLQSTVLHTFLRGFHAAVWLIGSKRPSIGRPHLASSLPKLSPHYRRMASLLLTSPDRFVKKARRREAVRAPLRSLYHRLFN